MSANTQALLMVRYVATGILFDGATTLLSRAGYVGAANGSTGIFSFWFNLPAQSNSARVIHHAANNYGVWIRYNDTADGDSQKIQIRCIDASGSGLILMRSNTNYDPAVGSGGWHHCIMSWNTADANKCKMYIDGVADRDAASFSVTAGTISYTNTLNSVGASGGALFFKGDMAEIYFAPNQWLDLTVAENILKFRSPSGHPVFLGLNGELPTGTRPILYFKCKVATIGTNLGSGGNFTPTGSFVDSITLP